MYKKYVSIEENDLEALLEYVKQNPYTIEHYVDRLKDKYKDEVIDVYKEYIYLEAKPVSKRKRYRRVISDLKM